MVIRRRKPILLGCTSGLSDQLKAVIQRPTTGQSANSERDLGALSLKWDANLLPQGSGIYKEKEAEKL